MACLAVLLFAMNFNRTFRYILQTSAIGDILCDAWTIYVAFLLMADLNPECKFWNMFNPKHWHRTNNTILFAFMLNIPQACCNLTIFSINLSNRIKWSDCLNNPPLSFCSISNNIPAKILHDYHYSKVLPNNLCMKGNFSIYIQHILLCIWQRFQRIVKGWHWLPDPVPTNKSISSMLPCYRQWSVVQRGSALLAQYSFRFSQGII